jgi:hypothetical protein
MNLRRAAVAGLAPWLTACIATVGTSGTTRVEQVRSAIAPPSGTVRVAPVVTIATGRSAEALSFELAPQLQQGRTSAVRFRAAARWSGRGAGHPFVTASIEQGRSRTSEFAGDTLVALPSVETLRARQLRGAATVRFPRGRRLLLAAGAEAMRSEGLGASADALPVMSSSAVEGRATWTYTRRLQLDATLRASSEQVGAAPALHLGRAATSLLWRPAGALRLTGAAGLVVVPTGGTRPVLELGIGHGQPNTGRRLSAVMAFGPEVDRLTGELTPRRRSVVRVETPLVPRVSLRGTLQESADIAGERQSVVRGGDTGLTVDLGSLRRVEIGVARFQQYSGGITTNAETRAFLQIAIAVRR